jgi:hypothetical protein
MPPERPCAGPVAQWLEPTAHNGLVGGSSPPGPTTQSCATGDFLKVYERPRIGGDLSDGSFSENTQSRLGGRYCAFFSGLEIPFPGNRDRERQRLGSNAGYGEGSRSIWCWRDHSAGMSARRATPMPRGSRPAMAAFTRSGDAGRRRRRARIEIRERLAGRVPYDVPSREFFFAPRRGKASRHLCSLHWPGKCYASGRWSRRSHPSQIGSAGTHQRCPLLGVIRTEYARCEPFRF